MIPLFQEEARQQLRRARPLSVPVGVTIVTGASPYPYLREYVTELSARTGANLRLVPVPSLLFGESVTVTGLVAGQDIVEALRGSQLGDAVIIPDVMLKEGEGVFLDNLSVRELQGLLGARVLVAESTPAGLYRAIRQVGRSARRRVIRRAKTY
jgi:NifB/MoaA-like Fe-S oxidoreductase